LEEKREGTYDKNDGRIISNKLQYLKHL